ncbi:MAG: GH1 family beta-glucosidase [Nocardioidaceae bacterium]
MTDLDVRTGTEVDLVDLTDFPDDFAWGAATAAYQIEGARHTDGRTDSIWDTFSHTPGRVAGGHNGDVAVDHYHRWREDVGLMAELGIANYRFSVSWPRVQPGGTGPANQRGLDFYRRLVDELVDHGITPWLTLYHWDLPQELEDAGGWPERDTADRFADYAGLVFDALGDRVRAWTTLNEPWCSAFLGYAGGLHAPGRVEPAASVAAAHHLLLGHGRAVQALRAIGGEHRIGITLNLYAVSAQTDSAGDLEAARRIDGLHNRFFLEPLFSGGYPADIRADLAGVSDFGFVHDGDLADVAAPLDLLGVNYYTRHVVGQGPYPGTQLASFGGRDLPQTAMGWEVDSSGLTEVLQMAARHTRLPIYVMENGAAYDDVLGSDGRVDDGERIDFLRSHVEACATAMRAGVPLRGYFVWSLLDNFEWARGYDKRFGLVYVDHDSLQRTPKASAAWYADLLRRHHRGILRP